MMGRLLRSSSRLIGISALLTANFLSVGCVELPIAVATANASLSIYEKLGPKAVPVVAPTGRLPCKAVPAIYLDGDIDGLTDSDLKQIVKHNKIIETFCE
jgi:hypothetical protein